MADRRFKLSCRINGISILFDYELEDYVISERKYYLCGKRFRDLKSAVIRIKRDVIIGELKSNIFVRDNKR